jgi:Type III restriction enzyme, res subunit
MSALEELACEKIDERSGYDLGTWAASLCGQGGISPVASSRLFSEPPPVVYNPNVPIETFDFIITDECHRSIYNRWRQVLECFDAYLIGLTATP